jgi:hypothetical protein
VSALCSLFSQILKVVPRTDFSQWVKRTGAEKRAKGFSSWDQLVAMLFCQLGRAHSLREIEQGLASCEGKLAHLGVGEAPARSTLSYANAHRPWQLFEQVFQMLFARFAEEVKHGQRKFRFKNKLVSLDSSVIDLCVSLFDWAKFRQTKGAVKLHLVLDHDGYLPCFALLTEGKVHDVKVAQGLSFDPGTIVVMDRGYNDYALFGRWCEAGLYFVTRLKRNALYEVIEERDLPANSDVLADQTIRLSGEQAQQDCPHELRRIEYCTEEGEILVFLTNQMKLAAQTIAALYKDRWQIELFFKALKQNLKIKTFVGTSANAVKIQVFSALIVMLILRYLQLKARFGWSLSNLVALLRMNLFTYRDLWTWLDKPFGEPPLASPAPVQETLALAP